MNAGSMLGKKNVGAFSDGLAANRKQVDVYSMAEGGTVSKLSIYLARASTPCQTRSGHKRVVQRPGPRRGLCVQVLRGVVYSNVQSRPGQLLTTSNELKFTSTSAAGWYDLTLTSPLHLGAGRYWIGVVAGAKASVARYRYDKVLRATDYNTDAYISGPTDRFGHVTVESRQISLYATYTNDPASLPLKLNPFIPGIPVSTTPISQAPEPPIESGTPVDDEVPVNSRVPSISGTAQMGQTLTATIGTWSGAPTSFGYQWQRCDASGAHCSSISLATISSYTITSDDINNTLRVAVTASNAAGHSVPVTSPQTALVSTTANIQRLEYVFNDNGLVSVYDMDHEQKLVKTISLPQIELGVRGVMVAPLTHVMFIAYGSDGIGEGGWVLAYDLVANKVLWTVQLKSGIDSGAVSPDEKRLYIPTGENTITGEYVGVWNILDTSNGKVLGEIHQGGKAAHNTVASSDGRYIYMGARDYNYLGAYDTQSETIRYVGPLVGGVRPFTVNGSNTLAFTTATGFDGFQVSSIPTGNVLYTVEFGPFPENFPFSTPSHGISLSPDEKQLYVIDSVNREVRVYDVSGVSQGIAPTILGVIPVSGLIGFEEHCAYDCTRSGWLQHSLDGSFVYVGDSGEVIDTATREVITTLPPLLNTKKSLEIDWANGVPIATSGRSGVGRVP